MMTKHFTFVLALVLLTFAGAGSLHAQRYYLGEILLVPYDFTPSGFAECNGQLRLISQDTALYRLIGTTYGGNGTTTFALPNLNGRIPIGAGQGAGLSNYLLGQTGGTNTVTMTAAQIPTHTHTVMVDSAEGTSSIPTNRFPAANLTGVPQYGSATDGTTGAASSISAVGGGQAHNNMMPYLGLKFIIAISGVYPPRN